MLSKHALATVLVACFGVSPTSPLLAQDLYFPPAAGDDWAAVSPAEAGYCPEGLDALDSLLAATNSKAFLLLKDGRIVHERYFDDFTRDSLWVWNSAAKSLTASIVGVAAAEGLLDLDAATSTYLGTGWTSLPPEREAAITVRHQLTMTTGLDEDVDDFYCTEPACLAYRAAPGTRWAYHNGPYTLLVDVVEAAADNGINGYLRRRILDPTGMRGLFREVGFNQRFISRPRDMARFGLLLLGGGTWDGATVLDADYVRAMTTPSQALNPAYGYLWWLNGQDTYRLPGSQASFPGPLAASAPDDAFAALGKDGQVMMVSPSRGEVWVRMGERPTDRGAFVPNVYLEDVSAAIAAAQCTSSSEEARTASAPLRAYLSGGTLHTEVREGIERLLLVNAVGQVVRTAQRPGGDAMDVTALAPGVYRVVAWGREGVVGQAAVVRP